MRNFRVEHGTFSGPLAASLVGWLYGLVKPFGWVNKGLSTREEHGRQRVFDMTLYHGSEAPRAYLGSRSSHGTHCFEHGGSGSISEPGCLTRSPPLGITSI